MSILIHRPFEESESRDETLILYSFKPAVPLFILTGALYVWILKNAYFMNGVLHWFDTTSYF